MQVPKKQNFKMAALKDKIEVIQGDITKMTTDAIVNAANSSLLGGGGVDGAIHRAGGPVILEECRKIIARQGGCKTGEAVITAAGNLPCRYVIHTVGPVWNGGDKNEVERLSACYYNSLKLAVENGIQSIAFPNIKDAGVYRFPKNKAAMIAVGSVAGFLLAASGIKKVIFVCHDEENLKYTSAFFKNRAGT